MLAGWSSERKIVAGFGLALISVALFLFSPFVAHPGSEQVRQAVSNQRKIFNELQLVLDDFKDAQLSQKSYVLSGEEDNFDEFNDSLSRMHQRLFALRAIDSTDARLADRFRFLENEVDNGVDTLRAAVTAKKAKSYPPERLNKMADEAILRSDAAVNEIQKLQQEQVSQLQDRLLQYSSLPNHQVLVGALLITFLALLALSTFLMSKQWQLTIKELKERNKELEGRLQNAQDHLDKLANKDMLTELLNVKGLEQSLLAEQNRAGRAGAQLIAMIINIDNFRKVNDGFGHAVGDIILKDLARRISNTLRPSDHLGRVGRDEFMVLLPETQLAFAMKVAERIRLTVADSPLRNASDLIHLTVSIGVAALPQRICSLEEVITLSRSALKRGKQAGKNRVAVARDGNNIQDNGARDGKDIVELLQEGTHFRTVFQPVMNLATENIAGYEIFTRGPDGAFESPAEFFRLCVENNILTTVDLSCLKQCIGATDGVSQNMRFHINVFPSTLLDVPIDQFLSLFPAQSEGRVFCIEISEQHFIGDPANLRDHVQVLRQAGILVAIDDVGFGRSSLESLILLEPDLVKVDRKYVTGVSREPAKARLLKRLANVAKSLGAEIVAEGIETKDDIPVLKDIGVHYGQGYLWGELMEVLPGDSKPVWGKTYS